MYKGGAGGYSFYVRGGEQVVRQRKNNSNYGDTASRSYAQMRRRVMWANLVNFYKENKFWMPKAFELRKQGQTDYNRFMQLNIPFSEHALTKDEALAGACAPFTIQVSEGSLQPIRYDNSAQTPFVTDIALSSSHSGANATVAELSQDILDNNPTWRNGDNLAVIRIAMVSHDGMPFINVYYYEFTLDTTDTTTKLSTLPVVSDSGAAFSSPYVSYPLANYDADKYAFVMIHTRKEGGQLHVSSQELIVKEDQWESLYSAQHIEEAILSYGLDPSVLLDPGSSFKPAPVIPTVTANGSEVHEGDSLHGAQTIVISDVDPSEVVLTVAGNEATPQSTTESSITFYVPTAGQVSVTVGGSPLMGFTVSANDISPLTGSLSIFQTNSAGAASMNRYEYSGVGLFESVTYPFDPSLTSYLVIRAYFLKNTEETVSLEDFSTVNCSVSLLGGGSSEVAATLVVSIQDSGTCKVFFRGIEMFNFEA